MNRIVVKLSAGMLAVGGLLFLTGLGWDIWRQAKAPPTALEMDVGAVVKAWADIPSTPTEQPSPSPTPTTIPPPTRIVSSPISRDTVAARQQPAPVPTWTPEPPTPVPTPSPAPSPVPTKVAAPARQAAPPVQAAQPATQPPTRIVAPAIGLDVKVVPMGWKTVEHDGQKASEWVVPSGAAGWHINSALPGSPGNTVVSGHNNIEGKVFRYLSSLEPGNRIYLYVGDQAYIYTVREKHILKEAGEPLSVREQNARWIMGTNDVRLTLVTCWPYQWPGNTHRVIVVATP